MNPMENQIGSIEDYEEPIIDSEDPTVIEEDPALELLDELFNRVSRLEATTENHGFALFHPKGHVDSAITRKLQSYRPVPQSSLIPPQFAPKPPASFWEKLYRSISLSAGIVLLGCIVAADISVDAKQRGELSTIALGSSFVAGWSVLMWGAAGASKREGDR